jgi:hypothetical protein
MKSAHFGILKSYVVGSVMLTLAVSTSGARVDEPSYIPGLHVDLDRVKARLDEIKQAQKEHPEWFKAVELYLTPVTPHYSIGGPPKTGPGLAMRRPGPEVLLADYERVKQQYPNILDELKEAIRPHLEQGIGASSLWDQSAEELRERLGIPEEDFKRVRELAGWEPLKYNPALLLAWEEALIIDQSKARWIRPKQSRGIPYTDWTHREHLLQIVLSFDDPKSLPIIGEVARFAARDLEEGKIPWEIATPLRNAIERIERERNVAAAVELADLIALSPAEIRSDIEARVAVYLVRVGGYDDGKTAAEWRRLLDELERQDNSWTDHANVLRRAIDVGLQKEVELKQQRDENQRKMEEQERRVKQQQEEMEKNKK